MAKKTLLSPNQDMAANPSENIWVQANAGTGKTSVLTQRLLRILFRGDNIDSAGILCLTYTNAGAGEMRNRILGALRDWAMTSDDELIEMLESVALNKPVTASDAAHARQIFFQYIDNPDVLKIKTIHGFCEEILRRFPIEAGISPAWTLVSDANQRVLLQDSLNKLVNTSQKNVSDNARINDAFAHIVGRVSENLMGDLLAMFSEQYKHFFQVNDIIKYRDYFVDTTRYFLKLDTPIQTTPDIQKLKKIVELAEIEIKSSKKPAAYLTEIVNKTKQYIDTTIDFNEYKTAWLSRGEGKKNHNAIKKDYLADELERVYQINQHNLAQYVFDDTMALFDLSAAFANTYAELKRQRNLLDFEDMILYTRRLFSNPETMGWVLSQLNVRLSHILVDEAQDTSPLQWDILRMLAGDFFTDGTTNTNPHSLFVVGDTKQSIYGFQGADPAAFATSRDDIATHIKQNMRTLHEIPLDQSFRSLGAILSTVDTFFDDETIINISGFKNNDHKCFRRGQGLVEIHKLSAKQSDGTTVDDYIKNIADKIKSLIDDGTYSARDIMVLIQNRKPMAAPLVAELKRQNIDVAGSDRIVLPNFPAIRDLLNLVRFCINPADDYSLCCVLKSPLFRLTEDDIFKICKIKNDTKSTVFDTLSSTHPDAHTRLSQILTWADTMAPYSFFSTVLDSNNARGEMIAALGTQIIDPLEEFLTICLSYERTQPGTLRHFLKWFITGDSEIKRDMDASTGVRVVTVHGSKGLEAPVIFLIDTIHMPKTDKTVKIPSSELSPILRTAGQNMPQTWLWSPDKDGGRCTQQDAATNAAKQIHLAEYYRLLYVAMTRARDRLYIYGFTPNKNPPENAWHTQLWRVLSTAPNADVTNDRIRIAND